MLRGRRKRPWFFIGRLGAEEKMSCAVVAKHATGTKNLKRTSQLPTKKVIFRAQWQVAGVCWNRFFFHHDLGEDVLQRQEKIIIEK